MGFYRELWRALRWSSEMLRKSHCQEAEPSTWSGRVGLRVVDTGDGREYLGELTSQKLICCLKKCTIALLV